MTIYIDVLIIVNIIVDYFLIKLSAFFLKLQVKPIRILLSSLLGGIFSLYILLPKSHLLIEMILRAIMSSLICLTAFGFHNIKAFFRSAFCLFFVTLCFGGLMFAIWYFLAPQGMVINNSVVYFNISPIVLIISSCAYYIIAMTIKALSKKDFSVTDSYEIELVLFGDTLKTTAIADTGNSLTDVFGNGEIIIVGENIGERFIKNKDKEKLKTRYRAVPCKCISGEVLLNGYRLDFARIKTKEKTIDINNVIMALSKTKINSEYGGIINPEILY